VHSSYSVRQAPRLRHDFNAEMLEEEEEEEEEGYDEGGYRYDSSSRGKAALSRRGGLDEDDEVGGPLQRCSAQVLGAPAAHAALGGLGSRPGSARAVACPRTAL
jgi:hypothetical protein